MFVLGLSHLGNGLQGSAKHVGQLQGWGWSWLQSKVAFSVIFSWSIYRAVKVTWSQSDARHHRVKVMHSKAVHLTCQAGQQSKF